MRATCLFVLSLACVAASCTRRSEPPAEQPPAEQPPAPGEDAGDDPAPDAQTPRPGRPGVEVPGLPPSPPSEEPPSEEPPAEAPPAEEPGRQSRFIAAEDPRLVYEGRFDRRDPTTPRCAWTGCALRARVDASAVDLQVLSQAEHPHDYLEVFVDDEAPTTIELDPGQNTVRVAEELSPGPHDITVMKRTEPLIGTIVIGGLSLEDALPPLEVPERPRSFLFIGDSITAGYGNEGEGPSCPFTATTENGARTYAALTARAFDAALNVAAWSGKGLYRNRNPAEPDRMPEIYDRLLPTEPGSVAPFEPVPDLVVVNLGTNDFANSNPPAEAFVEAYVDFVRELRGVAPNAPVLLGAGPMLTDTFPAGMEQATTLRAYLAQVVTRLDAEGIEDVHVVDFGVQRDGEPIGCDWHPHLETHEAMAETLIEAVEGITGWEAE